MFSHITPDPGHDNYAPLMWDQSAFFFIFMIVNAFEIVLQLTDCHPIKLNILHKLEYIDMKMDNFWDSLSFTDSKEWYANECYKNNNLEVTTLDKSTVEDKLR